MLAGSPRPNTARTPSANATSVAVGMGHPIEAGLPAANREIYGDRDEDAAERRDGGEDGPAGIAQSAVGQLELELDGDPEEEHDEQAVRDPVRQRE